MKITTETLIVGAGPAGLTAGYLLTKAGRDVIVLERGPGTRRRHQPHRRLQGLPVRHRRPPLLLEVEGGGRPLERDPAGRLHRAAAPVAHLLRRQVLLLSAEGLRGAAQPRRRRERGLRAVLRARQAAAHRRRRRPSTSGCATSSASGCSRSSSRPTPRRCGACPATRSPPTGRRSASRASTSVGAMTNALTRSLGFRRKALRPSGAGHQDADRDASSYPATRSRHDVGGRGRARSRERGGEVAHGPRRRAAALGRQATGIWTVTAVSRRTAAATTFTARHVISSAPIRELVEAIRPRPDHRCSTRARCATATSSPSR